MAGIELEVAALIDDGFNVDLRDQATVLRWHYERRICVVIT